MLKAVAIFALLFCIGGLGIASTITHSAIVEAVNEKLPREKQFEILGWYFPKYLKLISEYRRLYPTGGLLRRAGFIGAVMLLCLLLAAALIGFPVLGIVWIGGIGAFFIWFMYLKKSLPS